MTRKERQGTAGSGSDAPPKRPRGRKFVMGAEHKRFCEEYVFHRNIRIVSALCGYSESFGTHLLRLREIKAYIQTLEPVVDEAEHQGVRMYAAAEASIASSKLFRICLRHKQNPNAAVRSTKVLAKILAQKYSAQSAAIEDEKRTAALRDAPAWIRNMFNRQDPGSEVVERELLKPQAAPGAKTNTSATGESPSDIMKRSGNCDDSADAARAAEAQEFHRQAVIDRAAQAAADSDDDTARQRIQLRLLQEEPKEESDETDQPIRYTNHRPIFSRRKRSG